MCRIAAQAAREGENYFILLILTDGIISDMPQTCEAIVNVSLFLHNTPWYCSEFKLCNAWEIL